MGTVFRNLVGLEAHGSDGGKVGKVVECAPEAFTVEHGLPFPRDTLIPYEEISRVEGEQVVLREPAGYYRAGGDMDDGHWNQEVARRSRLVRQGDTAHSIGLHDEEHRPSAGAPPAEEDEKSPGGPLPPSGVHVPVE